MRASELLLIVRAQNQASGALRRVAGDLRGLSAVSGLRQRGQALQIARQQMMMQRQIASNELRSITTGKRALELGRARQNAELAMETAVLRRSRAEDALAQREAQALRNEATRSRLQRAIRTAPNAAIAEEARKRFRAAEIDADRLANKQDYLRRKVGTAEAAIASQAASLSTLSAREAEAARRADILRQRIANYGDRLRLNTENIKNNNRAIDSARWDRVAAGGRILQHTARVAEYAGLVLGGSLAVMAHQAANFETTVTLAATQTRKAGQSFTATAANSKVLQRDIRSLMTQFPADAQDFSDAAYDIFSSTDVAFGGGRKLLKLFAQASVAGMTDVKTATDAGIVVLNNFGNNVELMPRRLERMFAAVRFGRMTFADFATSMSTIGPAARAANQSFDTMAGTFAFLTRHLDVGKARVGFARVLEVLSSPKMLAGLKDAGVNIENANHQLIPLDQIIGRIIKKFPGLRDGGTDAMNFFKNIGGNQGTIQARRAFTFLVQFFDRAGKDGASYLDMLRKVREDNNEFTNSLAAMEKTTGVRWGVFINQLKALALAIGSDVIPALLRMQGPIEDIVHWWQDLDAGTRRTIAQFAAFAAVGMLVGGAISFIAGTFVRLFAFFGKFVGIGGAGIATLVAVGVAIKALTGDIQGLADVMTMITDFTFGSFEGFATTMTLATLAAIRLTRALKGMAMVEGATAGGGLLAGLFGRARNARAGAGLVREASMARGLIAGIGAAASLLPPTFLPTLAIVGAIGAGLALWKLHIRDAKADAAFIKKSFDVGAAPRIAADRFQQLPVTQENIERAKIGIRDITRNIASMREQLKTAKGRERDSLLDQIRLQTLDLADAQGKLRSQVQASNRQFDAYSLSFAKFIDISKRAGQQRSQLNDLLRIQQRSPLTPGIQNTIDLLRTSLKQLESQAEASASGMERAFTTVVRGLSKIGTIPKLPRNAIRDMFQISKMQGRMLTIPEMKAVIRAELDPRSIRQMPARLQGLFKKAVKIRVEADVQAQKAQKALGKLSIFGAHPFSKVKITAEANTGKAKKALDKLRTPIHKRVIVDPPANLAQIGAQISAGIQAGITPVHVQVIKDSIQKDLEIHSPSMWAAREIGKPISQGIALGILQAAGEIEKAATITMELFQGTVLSKLDEKKKPTAALLIKDLQAQVKAYTQFNNNLRRLSRRGVPTELVDELAKLGPEAAGKIAILANMSDRELRKYIRLWNRARGEIKRSMRAMTEDIKAATKELRQNMLQTLNDTFNQFRETNVGNFGALFEGPLNLADMVGDNFKQAMEEYNNQVRDFQNQIGDLNNQIVDAQKEAQQRLSDAIVQRREELQQQFGQLFGGDWLQGAEVATKIEWGQKLGFDDLQKDLEGQVTKFKRWRDDLVALASRVPPELGKQLEALGPEAVDKLDILNSATDEQLRQYVNTWMQGQQAIAQVASKTTVDTSDITARINDILTQIDGVTRQLAALRMPHELTGEDILNDLKAQQDQWIEYQNLLQGLIDRGIPNELLMQLQQMGPKAIPYLKALNSMTDVQLKELGVVFAENQKLITDSTIKMLNTQLALWYQYGKNIALNIIAGIGSEQPALQKYFKDLIAGMLRGQIPASSGVIFGDTPPINVNPPFPVGGGGVNDIADVWMGTTNTAGSSTRSTQGTNITVEEGAIQVNAVQDESLQSVLDRATFRILNRTPG